MSIKAQLILDVINALRLDMIPASQIKTFEKILWNHATEIIANYRP